RREPSRAATWAGLRLTGGGAGGGGGSGGSVVVGVAVAAWPASARCCARSTRCNNDMTETPPRKTAPTPACCFAEDNAQRAESTIAYQTIRCAKATTGVEAVRDGPPEVDQRAGRLAQSGWQASFQTSITGVWCSCPRTETVAVPSAKRPPDVGTSPS